MKKRKKRKRETHEIKKKRKEKRKKRKSGEKKMRKNGLFVKSGEVRRALMARKSMYILYNKEIAALDSDLELPSGVKSILKEFQDVFLFKFTHIMIEPTIVNFVFIALMT